MEDGVDRLEVLDVGRFDFGIWGCAWVFPFNGGWWRGRVLGLFVNGAVRGLMTLGTCRSVGTPAEGTKSLRVDYSLYSKEMILSRRLS